MGYASWNIKIKTLHCIETIKVQMIPNCWNSYQRIFHMLFMRTIFVSSSQKKSKHKTKVHQRLILLCEWTFQASNFCFFSTKTLEKYFLSRFYVFFPSFPHTKACWQQKKSRNKGRTLKVHTYILWYQCDMLLYGLPKKARHKKGFLLSITWLFIPSRIS